VSKSIANRRAARLQDSQDIPAVTPDPTCQSHGFSKIFSVTGEEEEEEEEKRKKKVRKKEDINLFLCLKK